MSSISGVSGSGNPWAALNAQRQAKMFAKVDADGSGSVDQAELTTMLDKVSEKTGVALSSNIADTFASMDSNSDGSLSSDELDSGMKALMPPPPPPSTMDFAQSRGTNGTQGEGDDLFSKIDTNGDGSVDQDEMKVFTDKIQSDTGQDASDMFAKLDADGDGQLTQAEFDAGRPEKSGPGPQGAGGPPPGGGPGGPRGAGGAGGGQSASSTSYDPLDTNQDGTVSEMERLVGELQNATAAVSGDGSDSSSASQKVAELAKQLYEQLAASWSSESSDSSTLSATA